MLSVGERRIDRQGFEAARSLPDRADRKKAHDAFFGMSGDYESSLGAALAAQVNGNIFQAKARHYPDALAAAIDDDNIPIGVYRTLIELSLRALRKSPQRRSARSQMQKLSVGKFHGDDPLSALSQKHSTSQHGSRPHDGAILRPGLCLLGSKAPIAIGARQQPMSGLAPIATELVRDGRGTAVRRPIVKPQS
jgi:hypothetical protein